LPVTDALVTESLHMKIMFVATPVVLLTPLPDRSTAEPLPVMYTYTGPLVIFSDD